ncbi:MAG: dipeptidase, partial [Phototrophicaceae bacterium]
MAKKVKVFDGHNDTLLNLHVPERGGGRNFFDRGLPTNGHIDLPRAHEAGFAGGFFAIFVPSQKRANNFDAHKTEQGYSFPMPPPLDPHHALQETHAMMSRLFKLERESDGQLKVTRTVDEIEACLEDGTLAAILHFEGAEAIDKDLNALEVFYQAGLRSLGLVWSRSNAFAHGVPLQFPSKSDDGIGLSDAGKALVRACNELGIMIDLSHLNGAGFWDVAALSHAPLVATHSNVYALCKSSRNLTDRQLDAIRDSDGIVGLNFGVGFLREDGRWDSDTPLEVLVRHIDYLVERIGIDRVGLGSDFDGVQLPTEIGDVTGLPKLINALRSAGYDDEALHKLAYQNWIRI